ncbi:hypothetical protein Patl1_19443 [Pistacia atlantica]|uniref:Uncharacterized protein n=1 Tax=Pistacia atlantica TaxID=434234 RepID=A0ACC1C1G5_9ROSI|nr:hypothetical protein Patl1_19443 [Pistacia atlantica]
MDERLQKATEERFRRLQRAAEEGDVEALFLILAEERLQRLQRAAADEDVQALFTILADEPLVLERFDEKAFLSTPLHTAEMEGRGPFDLDLEGKYQELVTWLIQIDSELVRVKSKGLVTPLHYAAEIDDDSNLADFLYVCPSSIRDLTVTGETAVHVAVKNGSRRALKVLLKWIQRFDKEGILNWEDEEGNNALHTAISENQIEVVKLLIEYMEVNKKNRQGLTALYIFDNHQDSLNTEVGEILLVYKDKRDFEVAALPRFIRRFISGLEKLYFSSGNSPVEYISGNLPLATKFLQGMGLGAQSIKKVPVEVLNVLLVVAALINTTTYQAALSPPRRLLAG